MIDRPLLLEATRMVATRWTGRSPTGIDRVCDAYARRFGARAQAVIQHRGVARILSPRHTDDLFALLADRAGGFRRRFAAFAPRAWAAARSRVDGQGAFYLNVSHTDYDLASHERWLQSCRLRPVYLVHDLIPITHPEYCRPRAVTRHRGRVVNALRMASGIIANSRATASDLERFAADEGLPMPPVVIAPLAGADLVPTRADVPGDARPYFLCLGTIEARKNHQLLLQVWQRLIEQAAENALHLVPHLVIVGQWGSGSGPVREMLQRSPSLRRHASVIGGCDDAAVSRWLSGAEALLLPTLAEGFGLPLIEALALGTPVIASDLPSFRESGQGIPCLLDPFDPAAWARAISAFSEPGGERERQHPLLARFRPPVWDTHFMTIEQWLASLPRQPEERPAPASGTADLTFGAHLRTVEARA
jgi:glycosyltransferase involved in cell wall biosynthesis